MIWLVEEGIGEQRAIRYDNETAGAARIYWPGQATAGQIADAKLISRVKGSSRGTAEMPGGEQVLVSKLPRDIAEGSAITIEITRSRIGESGRIKRAQARPSDKLVCPAPTLAEDLRNSGHEVQVVRQFPDDDWEGIWGDAWSGSYDFKGGSLFISPTPAMILIDIDGDGSPKDLALAACAPVARAIRLFDLGGSIGIDFPTVEEKASRKAVDAALLEALDDWPHEQTAMNGFGLVQIVAQMTAPSLMHRLTFSRAEAAARLLLRRAEEVVDPGTIEMRCHPSVAAKISEEWRSELGKRTGRHTRIETDPTLAREAAFAQAVPL